MKFYNIFDALCAEKYKSLNAVAKELHIPSGSITAWKTGAVPRLETLSKIAAYFDVSTDYLLGNSEIKKPTTVSDDGLFRGLQDPLDIEFSEKFAKLSPDQKEWMLAQIDGILNRRKEK